MARQLEGAKDLKSEKEDSGVKVCFGYKKRGHYNSFCHTSSSISLFFKAKFIVEFCGLV